MNRRNLLPVQRQHAKRRGRATRRWVVINCVYGSLLAAVGCVYAWAAVDFGQPASVAAVAVDIEKANTRLTGLRQESLSLKAMLQSVADVSSRPDWSVLLAAVSQTLGDDVVLNSLTSASDSTATTPVASAASGEGTPRRVQIGGVGRTQQAVTQFVLRIESMGFFDRVQLLQTTPRPWQGSDGIGFQVVCTLHDATGGH
ncbi:MAG TPA: PilN domain-containing protein [Tepidisphaeraceae bacterium]